MPGEDAAGEDGEDREKLPGEEGTRRFGHSKDHRDDLPQVVIAMAVTRDGIPVRYWTFPGNEQDQKIIRTVKDDLGTWNLCRLVRVADRRFASARLPTWTPGSFDPGGLFVFMRLGPVRGG